MKYRPKHIMEYALLRAVAAVVCVAPYRCAALFGCGIAALAGIVLRRRVKEARSRIREVFRDRFGEKEVRRIARVSLRNIVLGGVDLMRMRKTKLRWAVSVFELGPGFERLAAQAASGRGAIVACPHMGSWELAAAVCRVRGIPMFSFTARQHNPLVSAYMDKLRSAPGLDTISREAGVISEVVANLRAGKTLAILPDVRAPEGGIEVAFLGGRASVGAGMAVFARRADVPIFPCIVTRRGLCRHRGEVLDPILPDRAMDWKEDARRMTAAVMSVVDDAIRREPAQWFWYNRRWILDPQRLTG